jgi:hypothetical protein
MAPCYQPEEQDEPRIKQAIRDGSGRPQNPTADHGPDTYRNAEGETQYP